MILEQPSFWLRWMFPRAYWRMDKNDHSVYLTFDDGPIPEATPFILDTLRAYEAHATFFMVGDNVRKYPHLFERIVSEGHCLGNHTFHHLGGLKHLTHTYVEDVELANSYIGARLFRPPHGVMTPSEYYHLRSKYQIVMGDLVTRDYSRHLTAADVVENVRRYTRNGSIITFHDSLKSIDKLHIALPASLRWLTEQGYQFKVFE